MALKLSKGNWADVKKMQQEKTLQDLTQIISQKNPELFSGNAIASDQYDMAYEIVKTAVWSNEDLPVFEKENYTKLIMGQAAGYGPLLPFFIGEFLGPDGEMYSSTEITEVMVNPRPNKPPIVFYGWHGRQWPADEVYFKDNIEVKNFIQKTCEDSGRSFNEENAIADAWLADGSRLAAFGFKVNPIGPAFTIRKSPLLRPAMPLDKLASFGMFPHLVKEMIIDLLIAGHANIGFFGRTDSGKTTVVRACGEFFDPIERVLIGETSFELSFPHLLNCLNLVEVGFGDHKIITMDDICDALNRNNPDRSIVGEIRGKEIIAASEIAETTSGGFITTGHAGDIDDLRSRFPKMFYRGGMELKREHVDGQLATMFHFLLFFDKPQGTVGEDGKITEGKRTLMSLVEVKKDGNHETIIQFDFDECAASRRKIRRWIYNKPISSTRLGYISFHGGDVKPEYERVTEKYLYPEEE